MIKQIPNIITFINLLCGCIAVLFAVSNDLIFAAIFVALGIFFDFFDGLAARLLNAQSPLGVQLDSLADMVTSGLVPAIVMVQLIQMSLFNSPFQISDFINQSNGTTAMSFLPLVGLLVAVGSCYRLANFNIDTRQTSSFIGLPTPANALLLLSIPLILEYQNTPLVESIFLNPIVLIALTIGSTIILNAEVPLFALKFKSLSWKENKHRFLFIAFVIVAAIMLKFVSIPVSIAVYVVMSLIWKEAK